MSPTPNTQQQITENALGQSYADYVAQTLLSAPSGSVGEIHNPLQSPELDVEILQDPVRIKAQKELLAGQLNDQSQGPVFIDLAERIGDVELRTVAQGAATLTIKVIDPTWALLTVPDDHGNTFIQKDVLGRLMPVVLSWPPQTSCQWQLCTAEATTELTGPMVTLTFEDRIVSDLRNVDSHDGGVAQGSAEQTLSAFMRSLVDGANRYYHNHPEVAGSPYQIKFVEMVSPIDPNYLPPPVTSGGTTSVLHPQPKHRTLQRAKQHTGMTQAQKDYVAKWFSTPLAPIQKVTSILEQEARTESNPALLSRFGVSYK